MRSEINTSLTETDACSGTVTNRPPLSHDKIETPHHRRQVWTVDDRHTATGEQPRMSQEQRGHDAAIYGQHLQPSRLPNDVLRNIILEWCRLELNDESSPKKQFVDSLDTSRPQWICAQVCRSWRQAAFSCTSLWTSLRIIIPERNVSRARTSVMAHNLTSLLRWGGDLPLAIEVVASDPFTSNDPIFSIICSHSSRWQWLKLSLYFKNFSRLRAAFLPVKKKLPLLRSLSLRFWTQPPPTMVLDAFEEAPNLKSITVGNLHDIHHFLSIPWNRITKFRRLSHTTSLAVDDHLSEMANLEHYCEEQFNLPPGSAVDLSRLQTMIIKKSISPPPEFHWERFQMGPRFTEFRIHDTITVPNVDRLVVSFLLRWGSTLHILYLDNCVVPEAEMIRVARGLTSLSSFSYLYRRSARNTLFEALANTHLLPQLRVLTIYGFSVIIGTAMVDMLSARMSLRGSVFKKLGLPPSQVKFFGNVLGSFRTQGLEIKSTGNNNSWPEWPCLREDAASIFC